MPLKPNKELFSLFLCLLSLVSISNAQFASLSGTVLNERGNEMAYVNISLDGTSIGTNTNDKGFYSLENIEPGNYLLKASFLGYKPSVQSIVLNSEDQISIDFVLKADTNLMDEIVVTGTLKQVNRLESPVPVEVYNPVFFKKNPTPNIYEALQNVNGVRPQLNCQVCNTGDIHINGLEGPYTMVLIDGMPIVSSLATVYGLSGIPNSLIERMEVVKGPSSSLYGSEAIGGLINIITKNP